MVLKCTTNLPQLSCGEIFKEAGGCQCVLSSIISEHTYSVLRRICCKIIRDLLRNERKEKYTDFDGGNRITVKLRHSHSPNVDSKSVETRLGICKCGKTKGEIHSSTSFAIQKMRELCEKRKIKSDIQIGKQDKSKKKPNEDDYSTWRKQLKKEHQRTDKSAVETPDKKVEKKRKNKDTDMDESRKSQKLKEHKKAADDDEPASKKPKGKSKDHRKSTDDEDESRKSKSKENKRKSKDRVKDTDESIRRESKNNIKIKSKDRKKDSYDEDKGRRSKIRK